MIEYNVMIRCGCNTAFVTAERPTIHHMLRSSDITRIERGRGVRRYFTADNALISVYCPETPESACHKRFGMVNGRWTSTFATD